MIVMIPNSEKPNLVCVVANLVCVVANLVCVVANLMYWW